MTITWADIEEALDEARSEFSEPKLRQHFDNLIERARLKGIAQEPLDQEEMSQIFRTLFEANLCQE